jgi:hypothetical protein
MHRQDVEHARDACDRSDVTNEIETELFVEGRVNRVPRRDQKERIAVWRRFHYRFSTDITAGASPVLDDEWLAEPLRQLLPYEARDPIARATGCKAED